MSHHHGIISHPLCASRSWTAVPCSISAANSSGVCPFHHVQEAAVSLLHAPFLLQVIRPVFGLGANSILLKQELDHRLMAVLCCPQKCVRMVPYKNLIIIHYYTFWAYLGCEIGFKPMRKTLADGFQPK